MERNEAKTDRVADDALNESTKAEAPPADHVSDAAVGPTRAATDNIDGDEDHAPTIKVTDETTAEDAIVQPSDGERQPLSTLPEVATMPIQSRDEAAAVAVTAGMAAAVVDALAEEGVHSEPDAADVIAHPAETAMDEPVAGISNHAKASGRAMAEKNRECEPDAVRRAAVADNSAAVVQRAIDGQVVRAAASEPDAESGECIQAVCRQYRSLTHELRLKTSAFSALVYSLNKDAIDAICRTRLVHDVWYARRAQEVCASKVQRLPLIKRRPHSSRGMRPSEPSSRKYQTLREESFLSYHVVEPYLWRMRLYGLHHTHLITVLVPFLYAHSPPLIAPKFLNAVTSRPGKKRCQ